MWTTVKPTWRLITPVTCERIQEYLADYVEKTLEGALYESVSAHIERCAACRQDAALLKAALIELGHVPPPTPPLWLESQIMRRIDELERKGATGSRTILFGTRWLYAGLAAAALLAVAAVFFRPDLAMSGFFGAKPNEDDSKVVRQPKGQSLLKIEWNQLDGRSVPTLIASEPKAVPVAVFWTPDPVFGRPASPQPLWIGELKPSTTLAIPLGPVVLAPDQQIASAMITWRVNQKSSYIFVPTSSRQTRVATWQTRTSLTDLLRRISAQYGETIEYQASSSDSSPTVVLNKTDADIEAALNAIVNGSDYAVEKADDRWIVKPK